MIDASRLPRVRYRQVKRLWKLFAEEGPRGLKHRGAGRASDRGYRREFRERALCLMREKYRRPGGEPFGPTTVTVRISELRSSTSLTTSRCEKHC